MRLFRRNVLGVYAVYAAAIVSGLVVTPIVLHSLGTETFGIWSFIAATDRSIWRCSTSGLRRP